MEWVPRLCQAYAFQRALGYEGVASDLALHVLDRGHPDNRAANHCSRVRAKQPAHIDALLREVERVFAHCAHRLFLCDPMTPPEFVARLAIEGYRCATPSVLLRLPSTGVDSQPPPLQRADRERPSAPAFAAPKPVRADLSFEPVVDVGTWHRLAALLRTHHAEGGGSAFMQVSNRMIDGLIDSYRRKAPSYRFFLAAAHGQDHGYGAAVTCPNRVGLLDNLYTPAQYRGRGIATALTHHLVSHMRDDGAHDVMVSAPLESKALGFSQRLGFVPTCLVHEYEKQRGARA